METVRGLVFEEPGLEASPAGWVPQVSWHQINRYDMGGPNEYKRKYGGEEIYVPCIRRSKYLGLRQMRRLAQQGQIAQQRLRGSLKAIDNLL